MEKLTEPLKRNNTISSKDFLAGKYCIDLLPEMF